MSQIKVMTIASSGEGRIWSTPVYFAWQGNGFFFFSNRNSRHIRYSKNTPVSVSIFHDSNTIENIFGLQMSGEIKQVEKAALKIKAVRHFISKFSFLVTELGDKLLSHPELLMEKFKADLYIFLPDIIFFADNAVSAEKRVSISPEQLAACCQ